MQRCLRLGVIGLTMLAVGDARSEVSPVWGEYQQLLDEFVHVVQLPSGAFETRFDYRALWKAPDQKERLAACHAALRAGEGAELEGAARRAFDLNAYNLLLISIVVDALDETRGELDSILAAGAGDGAVFRELRLEVAGERYSADTWERRRVFAGYQAGDGPPPAGVDPRAHFALNCASIGCPTLLPEAFVGEDLDAQLDRAVRNTLASPRHLVAQRDTGTLRGSQLFGWYVHDFGGPEAVLAFVIRYAPDDVVEWARRMGVETVIADLPWDWHLNAVEPDAEP
jgi:hypothetical protein